MTLSINATVSDIEVNAEGNSVVHLSAEAGQDVTMKGNFEGATEYTASQIGSNTEGKVLSATIILVVEGAEPPLSVGKVLTFNSHFDRTPLPAPVEAPVEAVDPADAEEAPADAAAIVAEAPTQTEG